MMKRLGRRLAPAATATAAAAIVGFATPSRAQHFHAGDMHVASTADGSGTLAVAFDFDSAVPVSFDAEPVPGITIYTTTEPGFDALEEDEPGEGLFVLDAGTQVSVEITRIDPGRTAMLLNSVLLDHVGESVVLGTQGAAPPNDIHHHGTMQLILTLPPGTYGTGKLSFKLTTTSGAYSESQSYTVTLSNAHLAPIEYDGAALDRAGVKCQQTIGKEDRKLVGKIFGELAKCLDKANLVEAIEATGADAGSAESAAQRVCGASLPSRIAGFVARSQASAEKACSLPSPAYVQPVDLASHFDFVRCQAGTMAGAAYGGARALLAEFGGEAVADGVPCLGGVGER
jgi:hypothetical protein